jgi:hypothetical protein
VEKRQAITVPYSPLSCAICSSQIFKAWCFTTTAGYNNKETWTNWNSGSTTPNDYDLKGFGLGVKWQAAQDTEVVGYLSTRIGSNPAADANGNDNDGTKFEPRAWLSLVKQF